MPHSPFYWSRYYFRQIRKTYFVIHGTDLQINVFVGEHGGFFCGYEFQTVVGRSMNLIECQYRNVFHFPVFLPVKKRLPIPPQIYCLCLNRFYVMYRGNFHLKGIFQETHL